ncbi:MAG: copper-translocating P-type ATPase [Burkholderiales bacterium]|nr:copper-translocating P-type ATPase [Burkholderiales bacterium]
MHINIKKIGPGSCSICGMDLEPEFAQVQDDSELKGLFKKFLLALIFSSPFLIVNMGTHLFNINSLIKLNHSSIYNYLQFFFASIVIFYCGSVYIQRFYTSIINKKLNMFTLIGLSVGVAYLYSTLVLFIPPVANWFNLNKIELFFEPASMIIVLITLGQLIELKSRLKTNNAIRLLMQLTPDIAHLVDKNNIERDVAINAITLDMYLRVKPGEKIPADGIIIAGDGEVDQAMLTGESHLIIKRPDDYVIAGTVNLNGSFIFKTTKVGENTTLAQIINLINTASRSPAKIQQLVDTVAAYFVPFVIATAIVSGICWFIFGPDPKLSNSILAAISVLIIACPCALGLATPMSIMVATGIFAKYGILIKNSSSIEVLNKIDACIFDKTGTLTYGKPQVHKILNYNNFSTNDIINYASSLEINSQHPLGTAIVNYAKQLQIQFSPATEFKLIPGLGIQGVKDNHQIIIGNEKLMHSFNIDLTAITNDLFQLQQKQYLTILVAIDNIIAAIIAVTDDLKLSALELISYLKQNNITPIMLTGDNSAIATQIAHTLNITDFVAEMLPEQKYNYIKNLQDSGKKVAMVGDGINDAPALVKADVGIAIGNGVDIAIESADIILASGELQNLIKAFKLSKLTAYNIKQNLIYAFGYNIIAIPVAAGIFYPLIHVSLNPIIASAAMSLSSISVILNSLHLNKKKL